MFIVLGIGADDIFVFCDTWKETGQFKYKSLAHRISDAYRWVLNHPEFKSEVLYSLQAIKIVEKTLKCDSAGHFEHVLDHITKVHL